MLYERSVALSCVKVYVMLVCELAYVKWKIARHVPAVPAAGPIAASRVSVLPALSAAVMFVQLAADGFTSVNVATTVSFALTLTGPVVVVVPPAPPVFCDAAVRSVPCAIGSITYGTGRCVSSSVSVRNRDPRSCSTCQCAPSGVTRSAEAFSTTTGSIDSVVSFLINPLPR